MADETNALAATLEALLREKMAAQAPAPTFTPYGQATRAPGAAPGLRGVLFRCSVPLPDGSEASAYLLFDAEQCPNPQAIQQLAAYVAQSWPLTTFQPRQQWNGGNGGGGFQGGGNYGGGGYGGGYRGGRWGGRRW